MKAHDRNSPVDSAFCEFAVAIGLACSLSAVLAVRGLSLGYFSVRELQSACPKSMIVVGVVSVVGMFFAVVSKRALAPTGVEVLLTQLSVHLVLAARGWAHMRKADLERSPLGHVHSSVDAIVAGGISLKEGIVTPDAMTIGMIVGACSFILLRRVRSADDRGLLRDTGWHGLIVSYVLILGLSLIWRSAFGSALEVNVEGLVLSSMRHGMSGAMLLMLGSAARPHGDPAWKAICYCVLALAIGDLFCGFSALSLVLPGAGLL